MQIGFVPVGLSIERWRGLRRVEDTFFEGGSGTFDGAVAVTFGGCVGSGGAIIIGDTSVFIRCVVAMMLGCVALCSLARAKDSW